MFGFVMGFCPGQPVEKWWGREVWSKTTHFFPMADMHAHAVEDLHYRVKRKEVAQVPARLGIRESRSSSPKSGAPWALITPGSDDIRSNGRDCLHP
ncbi:hypothetical protein [Roseovarius sp.]|uniref:hypothetical protein n=1 Tax=Roseovarius sp. TaxID=1486281 RepID=UPI002637F718|nr:hypothetical protein [Roseovarius sp.]